MFLRLVPLQDRLSEADKYLCIAIFSGNNHHIFEKLFDKVHINKSAGNFGYSQEEHRIEFHTWNLEDAEGRKESKPMEGFKSIRYRKRSNHDDRK